MKLSVLALDYDGTIATRDAMSAAVREAVSTARRSGVLVVLVTGRLLEDLRRVAGDLGDSRTYHDAGTTACRSRTSPSSADRACRTRWATAWSTPTRMTRRPC